MGWASAGRIFEPVAQALVDLNAPTEMKRKVLGPLIETLLDGDWDTTDESLDRFRYDPVIVSLFYEHVGTGYLTSGNVDTAIGYDEETDRWVASCEGGKDRHGDLADGELTASEHNRLVCLAVAHDRDEHGGDGKVEDCWLMVVPA